MQRAEEIARSIAADRPAAADRWLVGLFKRVTQLRDYPDSGRMVPELVRPEIRQLPYPPYRIIYRADAKRVVILTIRHGRQEFDATEIAEDGEP